MGGNVRKAVADGRGDTIPLFLSEIPLLFYKNIVKPDIAVIQVSIKCLFLVIPLYLSNTITCKNIFFRWEISHQFESYIVR